MKLYLTLITSLIGFATFAQTLLPKIGFTHAFNSMEVSSGIVLPKTGFTIGVGYNLHLNASISFQPELNYIQKAFQSESSSNFSQIIDTDTYFVHQDQTSRYCISYLEVPLLIKVKVFHKNFFAIGGPSIAYGIGGSHQYEFNQTMSYFDPTHTRSNGKVKFGKGPESSTKDAYFDNRWDMGIQIGLGALLFKKIILEGRYDIGTVNLISNTKSKNESFQMSVSFPIKIKNSK